MNRNLEKMLEERLKRKNEMSELQDKLRTVESDIFTELIHDGMEDMFTINWRKLEMYMFGRNGRRARMLDG